MTKEIVVLIVCGGLSLFSAVMALLFRRHALKFGAVDQLPQYFWTILGALALYTGVLVLLL